MLPELQTEDKGVQNTAPSAQKILSKLHQNQESEEKCRGEKLLRGEKFYPIPSTTARW
jgi:hypothetical protein